MPVSTLTTKGQITMPRSVRAALGLQAGDKVDFIPLGEGFRIVAPRSDVHALRGRFAGRVKTPATIEEMNDAVEDEAARRALRRGTGGR